MTLPKKFETLVFTLALIRLSDKITALKQNSKRKEHKWYSDIQAISCSSVISDNKMSVQNSLMNETTIVLLVVARLQGR